MPVLRRKQFGEEKKGRDHKEKCHTTRPEMAVNTGRREGPPAGMDEEIPDHGMVQKYEKCEIPPDAIDSCIASGRRAYTNNAVNKINGNKRQYNDGNNGQQANNIHVGKMR